MSVAIQSIQEIIYKPELMLNSKSYLITSIKLLYTVHTITNNMCNRLTFLNLSKGYVAYREKVDYIYNIYIKQKI